MTVTRKKTSKPRLDTISPGSYVRLDFNGGEDNGGYTSLAIFLGISGDGDDREAHFAQTHQTHNPDGPKYDVYTWQAYRYNGTWAFGTSAQRLSLVEVI